jgi:hypothetical protein
VSVCSFFHGGELVQVGCHAGAETLVSGDEAGRGAEDGWGFVGTMAASH